MTVTYQQLVAREVTALGRAAVEGIKRLPGTLLVLPIIALMFGTEWSSSEQVMPISATVKPNPDQKAATNERTVALPEFVEDGAFGSVGVELLVTEMLELTFAIPVRIFDLTLQADANDQYLISAASDRDSSFDEISPLLRWVAPRTVRKSVKGTLSSRRRSFSLDEPVNVFRVVPVPLQGDGLFSVSGLRIDSRHRVPHVVLVPMVWIFFLAAWLLRRFRPTRRFGELASRGWAKADWVVSCGLICSLLLRLDASSVLLILVASCAALVILLCRIGIRRLGLAAALVNLAAVVLVVWLGPVLVDAVLMHKIGAQFDLGVDHRMHPDGDEVNSDGIRFKGEAEDVNPEDYNILFMGDSFTEGVKLRYDETVPIVFEKLVDSGCSTRIKSINLGWGSSSPLLGYRLLVDIGKKYQPDLVVYLLDLTDYHDDLDYEMKMKQESDVPFIGVSPSRVVLGQIFNRFFDKETLRDLRSPLRPLNTKEYKGVGGTDLPTDRFFIVNQELSKSRKYIERGVMTNLDRIHRYSTTVLNVPFAVVLVPRAFQYSSRESPNNWEKHNYEIGGPYVGAPSEYFKEKQSELSYPVLGLVPVFALSEKFPLFFDRDPHWNATGAHLAAETIAEFLEREKLLPCS